MRFLRRQHGDIPLAMAQSEPARHPSSEIHLAESIHSFPKNVRIGVLCQFFNGSARRRIADPSKNFHHPCPDFGISTAKVIVKLRQLSLEFPEFVNINLSLI